MYSTHGESGSVGARGAGFWFGALMILYLALYLVPLGSRPLIRPDETRYAEISREMIATGDWISPHFNGVRYFEKPVLGYWMNSASFELLGESKFAIRLPTALSAIATGLLVFFLTGMSATARAGLMASGAYLTSFGVLAIGTFAVLDTMFTLWVSLTIGAYWLAVGAASRVRRNWLLALAGLACGCAFLTKGFLAIVIPSLVVGAFLIWERRWRDIWTTPWIPLLVATLTALPWSIAVALREPDFWNYFFWVEHVGRFLSDDAQHSAPWWYYLEVAPLLTFPWIFLAPRAVSGLKSGAVDRSLMRYLVCWVVLPFAFFSASRGKLGTYILPCVVPFAILLGIGLDRCVAAAGRLKLKWSSPGLAAVFVLALAALVAAQQGAFGDPPYGTTDHLRYVVLAGMIGAAAVAGFWAGRSARAWRQMLLVGVTVLPFYLAATVVWPLQVGVDKGPTQFLVDRAGDYTDAVLVSDSSLFGTTSWALGRDDVYVIGAGEIAYGLSYPEDEHRRLDAESLASLISESEGKTDILIFIEASTEQSVRGALSRRGARIQEGKLVLWRIPARPGNGDG
jgi:4-amino-4-deoxy-L-arabinose transferase